MAVLPLLNIPSRENRRSFGKHMIGASGITSLGSTRIKRGMPFGNLCQDQQDVLMDRNVPTRNRTNVSVISIAFPDEFLRRRVLITLLLLTALYFSVSAQTVTEVITDYSGYWKSGQSAINTVKPDNSHNM